MDGCSVGGCAGALVKSNYGQNKQADRHNQFCKGSVNAAFAFYWRWRKPREHICSYFQHLHHIPKYDCDSESKGSVPNRPQPAAPSWTSKKTSLHFSGPYCIIRLKQYFNSTFILVFVFIYFPPPIWLFFPPQLGSKFLKGLKEAQILHQWRKKWPFPGAWIDMLRFEDLFSK